MSQANRQIVSRESPTFRQVTTPAQTHLLEEKENNIINDRPHSHAHRIFGHGSSMHFTQLRIHVQAGKEASKAGRAGECGDKLVLKHGDANSRWVHVAHTDGLCPQAPWALFLLSLFVFMLGCAVCSSCGGSVDCMVRADYVVHLESFVSINGITPSKRRSYYCRARLPESNVFSPYIYRVL